MIGLCCWYSSAVGYFNTEDSISSQFFEEFRERKSNILQTELWVIYIGLQLAWSHGAEVLQIQYDSKQVIQLIQDASKNSKALPLIRAIHDLCKQGWMTEFHWTSREGNKPADILAKMTNISDYNTITFATLPVELLPTLAKDSTVSSNMS
ncbi:hypothetical protein V6N11_042997 [Hibiscus sabdariffa]|uniref:RNase H type-1 domain-containing protein n=1 Tax=Hibiscus sabdariffa TaxID=183260 RepID=A0ABR2QY38_9ROSI